ncbi:MAG: choice-of-anchor L domain-containing protein [Sedimentisphaerales bacterium]|nr:choice-of-anchor L domain-containing protein [Sedimentisphaerales bacterium]
MRQVKLGCIIAFCLLITVSANAQISVTPMTTADSLVQSIMGSGISYSNVSYTGTNVASGTFTGGSVIGINTGILLTSGLASNVDSVNNSDGITGDNGQSGDTDLNSLIPGYTTHDATVLEFDFELESGEVGDLYFNYVFGSDEYNEYVDSSYNDVFGFFLDGTNIALIPGTSTAVAINNVNNGDYSSYYNDNDPSNGTPTPFAIEYDGFTNVLTAQALDLAEGTHHIKLAIADAGDFILDSGVFIQGGSFSDEPTPIVPVPGALLIGLLGFGTAGIRLRRFA